MILVDTSIWIEFFKQNPAFINEMVSLLESKRVITIEPIFSELVYGSRGEKEKSKIISYWNVLPRIRFNEGAFLGAASFANNRNYQNAGIGLIDAILAKATIENNLVIWTLDRRLLNSLDVRFHYKYCV
jgi:predicted nucleic acid-binding protein